MKSIISTIVCLFSIFSLNNPNVKEFFQANHWNYPLHYLLPSKINFYSGCRVLLENSQLNKYIYKDKLSRNSDLYNKNIQAFFNDYFIKNKIRENTGILISDPHFCIMDTLGDTQLLVKVTEYYYLTKVKKKAHYIGGVKKVKDKIYCRSFGAIFKIINSDSLKFFDWYY